MGYLLKKSCTFFEDEFIIQPLFNTLGITKMQIQFNQEKIREFNDMLHNHSFNDLRGLTARYRLFEVQNLTEDVKMKMLHKLSASNYLQIPSFNSFWAWFRKNHGMALVGQFCESMFPDDPDDCQKMINRVRSNANHAFWSHIKARIYKKWCSIVTEAQCVYATLQGLEKTQMNWKVFASADLDSAGIDFIIVNEKEIVPIQIKKDSFSMYARSKKNGDENLARFEISKKSRNAILKEMKKAKIDFPIAKGLLLKYGLADSGKLPYEYLSTHENGFVFFKDEKLISVLNDCFENQGE